MFCYQCEQTAQGKGCTKSGVCGKSPETADLQDILIYTLRGLALHAKQVGEKGITDPEANRFTCEALFATLTNVNFDPERFVPLIKKSVQVRDRLAASLAEKGFAVSCDEPAALFQPAETVSGLLEQKRREITGPEPVEDSDITSLQHIVLFGIKGIAAYADHAALLGKEDESVYRFVYEALAAPFNRNLSLNDWIQYALKCGEVNLRAMELLDAAHTETYGHPVPTTVPLGAKKGKAVLVSGHDLKDLEQLLKQTEKTGITVYTHGEMLPCHGYPELKKYPHFYGHYGTAWQNQKKDFDAFPGAILMTTNCIQKPEDSYRDKLFTTGLVGWPGVRHLSDKDFSPLIGRAQELPGFAKDIPGKTVQAGFGRQAVLNVAPQVIDAVKSGAIRHFFLVAGCDGAKPGRNYYTEFVEKVPQDCVVLTLACGKFRFFDKQLGDIGGIPRLLDVGQCNDAYSAVQTALALADAFDCGVNDLPLSLVLSWYEQKAVAVLLSLLHLGIKNIRLGPSLPAFITPNVLETLVATFDIKPIKTPDEDLHDILKAA